MARDGLRCLSNVKAYPKREHQRDAKGMEVMCEQLGISKQKEVWTTDWQISKLHRWRSVLFARYDYILATFFLRCAIVEAFFPCTISIWCLVAWGSVNVLHHLSPYHELETTQALILAPRYVLSEWRHLWKRCTSFAAWGSTALPCGHWSNLLWMATTAGHQIWTCFRQTSYELYCHLFFNVQVCRFLVSNQVSHFCANQAQLETKPRATSTWRTTSTPATSEDVAAPTVILIAIRSGVTCYGHRFCVVEIS